MNNEDTKDDLNCAECEGVIWHEVNCSSVKPKQGEFLDVLNDYLPETSESEGSDPMQVTKDIPFRPTNTDG